MSIYGCSIAWGAPALTPSKDQINNWEESNSISSSSSFQSPMTKILFARHLALWIITRKQRNKGDRLISRFTTNLSCIFFVRLKNDRLFLIKCQSVKNGRIRGSQGETKKLRETLCLSLTKKMANLIDFPQRLSYYILTPSLSLFISVNDLKRLIAKAGGELDHSLYAQSATHVGSLSEKVSQGPFFVLSYPMSH